MKETGERRDGVEDGGWRIEHRSEGRQSSGAKGQQENLRHNNQPSTRRFAHCSPPLWHPPHVHKNSKLSLVYYPSVPPFSSPLSLMDNRGGLDHITDVYPMNNSIVVFPSQITHYVGPTAAQGWRVSWSCNLPGKWTEVSDLNLEL